MAAAYCDTETVKRLVEARANVDLADQARRRCQCEDGTAGTNVTGVSSSSQQEGRTPSIMAAREGKAAALCFLVEEAQADISRTTKGGRTALHVAEENGHGSCVAFLKVRI